LGCYGLGVSRLFQAIAETSHDERGLLLPTALAPYTLVLLSVAPSRQKPPSLSLETATLDVGRQLQEGHGLEVVVDDRWILSFGSKMSEVE
jgi:prolyl-tRNA synthetase